MARPKKKNRLEHTVGVRLSLYDYSEAQVRAMRYGLPVSAWLREAAFGRRLARARPAVNQEAWGLLGRLIATRSLFKANAGQMKLEHIGEPIDFVGKMWRKLIE